MLDGHLTLKSLILDLELRRAAKLPVLLEETPEILLGHVIRQGLGLCKLGRSKNRRVKVQMPLAADGRRAECLGPFQQQIFAAAEIFDHHPHDELILSKAGSVFQSNGGRRDLPHDPQRLLQPLLHCASAGRTSSGAYTRSILSSARAAAAKCT
ncbi:MAG: hypothetical protein IH957_01815 [Chloroflexi bacterium]|nr:hypothetical protein [Chloroflexota bacterium]